MNFSKKRKSSTTGQAPCVQEIFKTETKTDPRADIWPKGQLCSAVLRCFLLQDGCNGCPTHSLRITLHLTRWWSIMSGKKETTICQPTAVAYSSLIWSERHRKHKGAHSPITRHQSAVMPAHIFLALVGHLLPNLRNFLHFSTKRQVFTSSLKQIVLLNIHIWIRASYVCV